MDRFQSKCSVTIVKDIKAWDETQCPNPVVWVGIANYREMWVCSKHFDLLPEGRILSVNEYWREHGR